MKIGRPNTGGHIRYFRGNSTPYRLIRVNGGRQQLEHRVVMARILGRPLLRSEIVHHIDGNGLNNSPDNLEVLSQTEHRAHRHGGPRRWSIDEAISLRKQGLSFDSIAERLGVVPAAILKVFARRGIVTGDLRCGYSWDVERAAELYATGESLKSIARLFGIKSPSVRKAFVKRGITLRPHPPIRTSKG